MGVKTKEMKVLSIEQMNQLKELGVDVKPKGTCLMYTSDSSDNYYLKYGESTCDDDIKAFTLQDILNILPFFVEKDTLRYRFFINHRSSGYELSYMEWADREKLVEFTDKDPLEAAYNMLIWVIENGYLKTK